jgi:FkbM family methyltransferase
MLLVKWILRRFHLLLNTKSSKFPIVTLGSDYGLKKILSVPGIESCTVIAAGAGEDLSFDFEIAASFGCKVIVVDPTPRAIEHFSMAIERIGKVRRSEYLDGGSQPIDSYDLVAINPNQVVFVPEALWVHEDSVSFFPPPNPNHVSFSITNLQGASASNTKISVKSTTVNALVRRFNLKEIGVLKLDIEGAAPSVCKHMFRNRIYPQQIILEFDEMLFPTVSNMLKTLILIMRLRKAGYSVAAEISKVEYLFALDKYFD